MEFLGDAVLDLIIGEFLFRHFPDEPEGELSKIRASLVSTQHLSKIAQSIGLGECILLGKGEMESGGATKPTILANCLEAVISAVYLDSDFAETRRIILPLFERTVENTKTADQVLDPKTRFQEMAQATFRTTPTYRISQRSGPDHDMTFEVELFLGAQAIARGTGKNKKAAEFAAAERGVEWMANHE
jgi:ribonuclease-3